MIPAALHPVTQRRDPNAVVVPIRLTLPEAIALYGPACQAELFMLRAAGTAAPPSGDAAAVLHRATCKLYVALYDVSVRGGL